MSRHTQQQLRMSNSFFEHFKLKLVILVTESYTYLIFRFKQDLIIFTQCNQKDNGCDIFKTMNPFSSFWALTSNIHHPAHHKQEKYFISAMEAKTWNENHDIYSKIRKRKRKQKQTISNKQKTIYTYGPSLSYISCHIIKHAIVGGYWWLWVIIW